VVKKGRAERQAEMSIAIHAAPSFSFATEVEGHATADSDMEIRI